MATVTGPRGTKSLASGQFQVDMSGEIMNLQPDAAPLTVLSAKMGKKPTEAPEFSWWEDDLEPRFDAINNGAGYASGITALVVDNGAYFAEHDLVLVTRTLEVLRVTSVVSNTINVIRGVGSTAAALVDDDELIVFASAQPEGDTSKPARSSNATKVTNYTQIHRLPWELTDTLRATSNFTTPADWNYEAKKKGIEHKKSIEYTSLFGTSSENTSGAQPRRTSKGVVNYITTNATDAAGALTETEFFGAVRNAFRYGSKTKLMLGSALAVDVLNTYARGKVQVTQQRDNTYGVDVIRYVSPHGTLNLATHWLLEGTKFGGYIFILDMDEIRYRVLSGNGVNRDTHIRTNIQAPDSDTRKDEYLTECGMQFGQEKRHAVITGITS